MNYNYDTDDYEQEEIILHPSEGPYIINALTGEKTKYLVDSKYETLFWKMVVMLFVII